MDELTFDLDSRIDMNVVQNIATAFGITLTEDKREFSHVTFTATGDGDDLDAFEEEVFQYEAEMVEIEEEFDNPLF
jgi:hypothetical protein